MCLCVLFASALQHNKVVDYHIWVNLDATSVNMKSLPQCDRIYIGFLLGNSDIRIWSQVALLLSEQEIKVWNNIFLH